MTRVFISHSSHDDDFVTQLAADLRVAGVRTWVDHQDIPPGADWDDSVEAALETCDVLVLVLTPRAVGSENVKVEWNYFIDLDKPIFPVIHGACKVPFRLRLRQQIDFTQDPDQARAALLAALDQARPAGDAPAFAEPDMVLIPAGPFLMGSDPARDPAARDDEIPQHTITLPDVQIARYPTTVGAFRAFVEAGGYGRRRYWPSTGWAWREETNRIQPDYWDNAKWTGDDRLPVVGISWYEAVAYCRWLAAASGRPYRLPTEAEWEKAARGTDGRIFPWGDTWRDGVCNTEEAGISRTTPVGTYSPAGDSPYGVADMSGNVWEWCQTPWRADYRQPPADTPDTADGGAQRVLRGGAWYHGRDLARAAARLAGWPNLKALNPGFRVALPVDE